MHHTCTNQTAALPLLCVLDTLTLCESLHLLLAPGALRQSLARLGADVHGIDVSLSSVRVARSHSSRDPLLSSRLSYSCATAESLLALPTQYDLVCAFEVMEHVPHAASFVDTLGALVRPGGLLAVSTLSRTWRSYLLAVVAPERLLRWLPVGAHDWRKFLAPTELTAIVEHACHPANAPFRRASGTRTRAHTPALPRPRAHARTVRTTPRAAPTPTNTLGLRVVDVSGLVYNHARDAWSVDPNDTDVNYMLVAARPSDRRTETRTTCSSSRGTRATR